jgi:glycerophosphoryl diester phosphodiesterase
MDYSPAMPTPTCPLNIAHRGASVHAPEHTMEAFARAVADGAVGLELDLQRTRDGEVIVLHDATLDRTTDGHGRASELDLRSLRILDAGAQFRDERGDPIWRGRGVRIPTLEEVLQTFPTLWLSLDLKHGDPITEARTIELLRKHDRGANTILGAEDAAAARRLRAAAPEFHSFFSRAEAWDFFLRLNSKVWWGYQPPARSLQIPTRHRLWNLERKSLIETARRWGIRVSYWTVNDKVQMMRLCDLGADALITDRPDLLHELLSDRRRHARALEARE